jgi:hypothetical protein
VTLLDHPDTRTTRVILAGFADSVASGWAGRQLPRMFGQAGIRDVTVRTHTMPDQSGFFRTALAPQVARLVAVGALDTATVQGWWAVLDDLVTAGWFTAGITWFLVAGTVD